MKGVKRVCEIAGCAGKIHGRGMCPKHYMRWRATGTAKLLDRTRPLAERFWEKVEKGAGCWVWSGYVTPGGYGAIKGDDGALKAHRVAYELAHGPILDGMQVDHICRNPPCVNPDHLRQVTNKQNSENRIGWGGKHLPRGVTERNGRFRARVIHFGVERSAGVFDTPGEAGRAAASLRLDLYSHNDIDRTP